jgi:hypothetical protein
MVFATMVKAQAADRARAKVVAVAMGREAVRTKRRAADKQKQNARVKETPPCHMIRRRFFA